MPNSDPIVDDPNQMKRSDKANEKSDENIAIEDELTFEFRVLMGHLENLYSDQCYLRVLSREASKRAPEPVAAVGPEQSCQVVAQATTPAELESAVTQATFDEHEASRWALMLDVPQIVILPPTQNQCGAKHWEILKDAAAAIEDALLSLSSYQGQEPVENYFPAPVTPEDENVEYESEYARLEAEVTRRIAQSTMQVRGEVNPETDGFYLSQLQRELDSIVRLVRCAANSCILVGDFNAATIKAENTPESDGFPFARVSRAVCWVGKSLGQRANEIEDSAEFLSRYIEEHPGIAPKASEVKDINRFSRKVREFAAEDVMAEDIATAAAAAAAIKDSAVVDNDIIYAAVMAAVFAVPNVAASRIDKNRRRFTPREIGKYFLQRNPDTIRSLIAEMEDDEIEGPFLRGSNGLYTKEQGMRMLRYYINVKKPGNSKNKRGGK